MILPELLDAMSNFKAKSKDRMDKQFFGIITGQLLRRLPEQREQMLKNSFTSFYKTTSDYVSKWFCSERYPNHIEWLTLSNRQLVDENIIELASTYFS
ncbi:hypothetical protein niasHT_000556 [Heterodera trifolii]|uniref:Uncharacterized protein n=1 Tax=Heterodera trifolii TaxID=157864 RepID=A0ABD2M5G3_9BILA